MNPLSWFWNIPSVIYQVRAFLKHLLKDIPAILTISDDVSILRFRYMLRSNPEHSEGRDRSNYASPTGNVVGGPRPSISPGDLGRSAPDWPSHFSPPSKPIQSSPLGDLALRFPQWSRIHTSEEVILLIFSCFLRIYVNWFWFDLIYFGKQYM